MGQGYENQTMMKIWRSINYDSTELQTTWKDKQQKINRPRQS